MKLPAKPVGNKYLRETVLKIVLFQVILLLIFSGTAAAADYQRIVNVWKNLQLYEEEGRVLYGTPEIDDYSSHWKVEKVGDGTVRIMNRASGNYLNIRPNQEYVEAVEIKETWESAKWYIEYAEGIQNRIRNSWQDNNCLHIQDQQGYLQHGPVYDTWGSAKWILEDVEEGEQLPVSWTFCDIGSPEVEGSAAYRYGEFTISGGGADIWRRSDEFAYVYQDVSDEVSFVVRVVSQEAGHKWAKAGIMFRENTEKDGKHVSLFATPGRGLALQYRADSGKRTFNMRLGEVSLPVYLRLDRNGSTFRAYKSVDGAEWEPASQSVSVEMGGSIKAGLCVTSHDRDALSTVKFTNVRIDALLLDAAEKELPQGVFMIKNIAHEQYLYLDGNMVRYGEKSFSDQEALWLLEDAPEGYKRVKNVGSGSYYMNIENLLDYVECTIIYDVWESAQWLIQPTVTGWRINNRWNSWKYINIANLKGYAECSEAMSKNVWIFEEVE